MVMTKRSPFKYFKTRSEIIGVVGMLYVRFPLSLRNIEDLLHELGIEVSHEAVRFWRLCYVKATKTIGASVRTRNLSVSPPAHNITIADAVVPAA